MQEGVSQLGDHAPASVRLFVPLQVQALLRPRGRGHIHRQQLEQVLALYIYIILYIIYYYVYYIHIFFHHISLLILLYIIIQELCIIRTTSFPSRQHLWRVYCISLVKGDNTVIIRSSFISTGWIYSFY